MPRTAGDRIGVYVIRSLLGKGGMGEVYRARDSRLGRDVAIKSLPAEVAREPDRLARFHREARTLAALNHPNIAAIYGLEESGGGSFLVLELVEGETLAERLQRTGPVPLSEALSMAAQITGALEAAHAQGITHRDIKPANIKVTPEGRVKVLDFGLAKSREQAAIDDSLFSTLTAVNTQPGVVMGTPSYMSPEQVRGQAVDRRTDVWAFGCVLYELLAAKRAFRGPTPVDTLAAVLQSEPDLRFVPEEVRGLLRRCLEKESGRRWPSFKEVSREILRISPGAAAAPARAQIGGLVVLPLRNLSGDPEQEFFADGITEALIWELAKLRALRVISRTSAMRYKMTSQGLPEIAQELNVDAVIEGSVARAGNRVLIRAQLIEASSDTMLWSESYDRELKDVLIVQAEIARTIAREIHLAVTPEESRRMASARTVNPEAYEAYLRGQFHWARLTPHDLDIAMEYFEKAREGEPALGYSGIAAVWVGRVQMGLAPPSVGGPAALEAGLRAAQADDSLPEVHYILALLKTWGAWDWEGGKEEFARTLALRANFAEARAFYAHFLVNIGRIAEAVAEMKRALTIDPHNVLFRALYGIVLVFAREYDHAVREFQAAQRAMADNAIIRRGLLMAFHMLGRHREALESQRRWYAALGDTAMIQALEGPRYDDSLRVGADTLAARARTRYIEPFDIAQMYVCAGNHLAALEWLEKGLELRDPDLPYLRTPTNDPLRNEPRFQAILRAMRLPQD